MHIGRRLRGRLCEKECDELLQCVHLLSVSRLRFMPFLIPGAFSRTLLLPVAAKLLHEAQNLLLLLPHLHETIIQQHWDSFHQLVQILHQHLELLIHSFVASTSFSIYHPLMDRSS